MIISKDAPSVTLKNQTPSLFGGSCCEDLDSPGYPESCEPSNSRALLVRGRLRCGIEQVVARVFGVACGELRLVTRGRANVALARQVAMYLAHVVYGLSLTEVGRVFDRDRTTVSHACGVVEDRRDDPMFDRVLENLESIVVVWPARGDRNRLPE